MAAALAQTSREAFHVGRYDEALSVLQKLAASQLSSADSVRVQHNVAVASFYQRGCSEPVRLLEALLRLRKRSGGEGSGDESRPGEDGSGDALGDEEGLAMSDFNQAVLFFHAKQYGRAASILEALFRGIDPLDEALAIRICFLLLDLYHGQGQTERAAPVLAWLERTAVSALKLTSGGSSEGAAAAAEEAAQAVLLGGRPFRPGEPAPPLAIPQPQLRLQLLLARARHHLLAGSFKAAKREIKSAINTYGPQPALFFLKAHLEFTRGNHRKAVKLLGGAMSPAGRQPAAAADPTLAFLYYNNLGCVHSRLGKFHAAAFYLMRALRETEALYPPSAPSAGDFGLNRGAARALPAYARDRKSEVFYNLGVQLLLTSKPALAFSCFQESAAQLYNRPSLWVRLAECCIAHHAAKREKAELVKGTYGAGARKHVLLPQGESSQAGAAQDDGPVFSQRILQGSPSAPSGGPPPPPTRRRDAAPQHAQSAGSASESLLFSPVGGSRQAHAPTLSYAAKCCRNALYLLSRPPPPPPAVRAARPASPLAEAASSLDAPSPPASPPGSPGPSSSPGAPGLSTPQPEAAAAEAAGQRQRAATEGSALACLAYVSLSLGDAAAALDAARRLASAPSPAHRLHAALYAAEALACMGRVEEAAEALTPGPLLELLEQPGMQAAAGAADPRALLFVDLAAVRFMQGDVAGAERCLDAAARAAPLAPHVALSRAYLELRRGNKEAAVEALRRRRAVPAP